MHELTKLTKLVPFALLAVLAGSVAARALDGRPVPAAAPGSLQETAALVELLRNRVSLLERQGEAQDARIRGLEDQAARARAVADAAFALACTDNGRSRKVAECTRLRAAVADGAPRPAAGPVDP